MLAGAECQPAGEQQSVKHEAIGGAVGHLVASGHAVRCNTASTAWKAGPRDCRDCSAHSRHHPNCRDFPVATGLPARDALGIVLACKPKQSAIQGERA
jgi:hypothetical protein